MNSPSAPQSNPSADRTHYDVIVLGCGSMGSAACYHLARRGFKVLGIEQFDICHTAGSHHGDSRMIRLAYFEDPKYVRFVQRSLTLWKELEQEIGAPGSLFHRSGSLDMAPVDGPIFTGSVKSCIENKLPYEILTGSQIRSRFPALSGVPDELVGCFQPDAGFLDPEQCIRAYVHCARRLGAEIHCNERVENYQVLSPSLVQVNTSRSSYTASRIVVTAGAWTTRVAPSLTKFTQLSVERQVIAWFDTQPSAAAEFEPGRLPIYIAMWNNREYYGFPTYRRPGMKMGVFNHLFEKDDPDCPRRQFDKADEDILRPFVENITPKANGKVLTAFTCMFTNSIDHHFIIDFLPNEPQVLVVCGFSGHGFKFASAIGELIVDMLQGLNGESTDFAKMKFSLDRFKLGSTITNTIHSFKSSL